MTDHLLWMLCWKWLKHSHNSKSLLCVGIIHRDLKPANFVIINASLKLIDFGIANRIQPDVTSVMKDSPVNFWLFLCHLCSVVKYTVQGCYLMLAMWKRIVPFFIVLYSKKMFLFSLIKTGTINYMSPEVIRDTSSQSGKARSKVLLQREYNKPICYFWAALWRFSPSLHRSVQKEMFGPSDVSCTTWHMGELHSKRSLIRWPKCTPSSILPTTSTFLKSMSRTCWMY